MAGQIKGITIQFRGDTTSLDKALRKVQSDSKSIDSELRKVNNALKFNPKNVELLTQKQGLMREKVAQTEKSLEDLRKIQSQMDAKGISEQSREYQQVRREIIETESKLKHFQSEAKKLENVKLTALKASLDDMSKKFEEAGKNLTKYVTVPLTALGTASVVTGLDFDAAMSQVAATMGKTTDEIQVLRDFALEMGETTAFSATEAAQALNYMALAGYSVDESIQMLPTVLNLAAAGNMDLARASDAVTDAQTALGLSFDETTVLVDQMAKTASVSNTSVEQLSEAILTVGGTARGMRGGISELNAVLGALADNGIKGSEGGTALRNVLLKLQDPTSKTATALQSLGISAYDADGHFRDLRELFPEIAKALDGLSEAERNDILSDMFNVRDISKANALLNTSVDRWGELSDAIDNAGGSAEKMADTQLDNLKGDLTLLKSALEGAAIAVSDVLSPVLRKLADWITKVVDKFNKLSPTAKKVIVVIGGIAAAIGPLLLTISVGMKAVSTSITTATKIIGGFSKALSFLAANPIVLIIAGITALVAAFVILWNKSEAFRNFFINLWNGIKTTVTTIWNGIVYIFTNSWSRIQAIWNGVGAFFSGKWQQIKNVFASVASWFGSVFGSAWNNIKSKFSAWGSFWSGLWTSVKNKFSSIGSAVGSAISGAVRRGVNAVIGKVESVINGAISLINGAIALADKIVPGKLGRVKKVYLPRLAEGGIVNSATVAMIGEGKSSEAVIPLDELWKRLDKMTAQLTGSADGSPIVVNVYGAAGQNVNELAAAVAARLTAIEKQKARAWA